MNTTIRARVRNGKLEPINPLDLPEGAVVEVLIVTHLNDDHRRDLAALRSSFGGWKGLIDADAFHRDLQASRKLSR